MSEIASRSLRVGVQLPEVERPVGWPETRDIARSAEDAGFDSVWVGDHLLYRDPDGAARGPMEAWSQLAALAEATDRVSLAPLVAATAFHSPAMLAKKAAAVDEISGGRLILGLGAGWNRTEFEAFGYPFDHRVGRFAEAFEIIRRLLDGEIFDFDGEYYTLRGAQLDPPARPGIPVLIGSNGPRMLRLTLPYAAMWNTFFSATGNRPEGLEPLMEVVDEACNAVGRDPKEVERTAAVLVRLGGGDSSTGRRLDESVAPLQGDAHELAESLEAFGDAGVTHLQLVLDPITAQSVERMGDVLRLLR